MARREATKAKRAEERAQETGVCPACGDRWTGRVAGRKRKFCGPACSRAHYNRLRNPLRDLICPCGKAFQAAMRSQRWCSAECRTAAHTATRNHLRRGLKSRATGELVTVGVIAARDGWACHLCGSDVDQALVYPHPLSASIDHITPVSDGGLHALENVALAHLRCNVARGRRALPAA